MHCIVRVLMKRLIFCSTCERYGDRRRRERRTFYPHLFILYSQITLRLHLFRIMTFLQQNENSDMKKRKNIRNALLIKYISRMGRADYAKR